MEGKLKIKKIKIKKESKMIIILLIMKTMKIQKILIIIMKFLWEKCKLWEWTILKEKKKFSTTI